MNFQRPSNAVPFGDSKTLFTLTSLPGILFKEVSSYEEAMSIGGGYCYSDAAGSIGYIRFGEYARKGMPAALAPDEPAHVWRLGPGPASWTRVQTSFTQGQLTPLVAKYGLDALLNGTDASPAYLRVYSYGQSPGFASETGQPTEAGSYPGTRVPMTNAYAVVNRGHKGNLWFHNTSVTGYIVDMMEIGTLGNWLLRAKDQLLSSLEDEARECMEEAIVRYLKTAVSRTMLTVGYGTTWNKSVQGIHLFPLQSLNLPQRATGALRSVSLRTGSHSTTAVSAHIVARGPRPGDHAGFAVARAYELAGLPDAVTRSIACWHLLAERYDEALSSFQPVAQTGLGGNAWSSGVDLVDHFNVNIKATNASGVPTNPTALQNFRPSVSERIPQNEFIRALYPDEISGNACRMVCLAIDWLYDEAERIARDKY